MQLISEVAAHRILRVFKLPLCNILFAAGGNFYILLPNTKEANARLNNLQAEFDKRTYERFKAEINLTLVWVEAKGEELIEFKNLLGKIKRLHHEKKYLSHVSLLIERGQWRKEAFVFDEIVEGDESVCGVCRNHPLAKNSGPYCEQCSIDTQIGENLRPD